MGLGLTAAGYAIARHLGPRMGHQHEGGVLIGNARAYDLATRVLFGSFYRGVAEDVAGLLPEEGRVLDVGCGPGHVAMELAATGLDVIGIDLDPAMIERARAKAPGSDGRPPSFDVGDVATMPYDDDSFDLVVSTLALHHWSDPEPALKEIARVLEPGGRALIWDFGAGHHLAHGDMPPLDSHFEGSPLQVVGSTPWRWPFGFTPTQRMELTHRPT